MVQPQMGTMTRWFLTLLTGGALALSGCSMALSGPSPDRPRNKPPQCDTSKGLVFADALIASTLGIVAASVASSNGGEAILPLIGAGVFVASAVHGNNVVNACNREIGNYNSEVLAAAPDPDVAPSRHVVAAMPPAMSPPPPVVEAPPPVVQPAAPVVQSAPPQPQPRPQPQPQPEPRQQPEPSSSEPWAAFWKESP